VLGVSVLRCRLGFKLLSFSPLTLPAPCFLHYIPIMQFVECEVMRLGLDRSNNSYVVILREKSGERLLPIWIGQAEAESIVIEMSKLKRERPLTHDLCKTLITGMGGSLRRIQITKVENRTYYAELHIRLDDRLIQIDARPSDSIAIALRFAAPIFAQDELLTSLLFDDSSEESDSITATPEPEASDQMTPAQLQKYLENLRPEDLGKFNI
ncbi:MAG TPA: bifunctional nuclease family protein, partial [Gemmatimonadaceae bacterium]|nr:bifunctional nuclease family protein [Gemmatimonadaceae bacterium]